MEYSREIFLKEVCWQYSNVKLLVNYLFLKGYLKSYIGELKIIFQIKDQAEQFNEWIIVYNDLCSADNLPDHHVQAQPANLQPLLLPPGNPRQQGAGVPPPQLRQGVQDPPEGWVWQR